MALWRQVRVCADLVVPGQLAASGADLRQARCGLPGYPCRLQVSNWCVVRLVVAESRMDLAVTGSDTHYEMAWMCSFELAEQPCGSIRSCLPNIQD
ncbi:Uncharacterised protein [Mycobacteroides abscessus subsp. abscessus]|nr:Uncharacterised protein [Mycobacteroides abscessus subsp. abscessus]